MSTSSALDRVTSWIAGTFHPRGRTFVARVVRHPDLALDLEPLAERFAGDALVRFSGLGCAVRFRHDHRASSEPELGDADLLVATVLRPTNVEDYLANDYYAVSPFDVGLVHALQFRLRPEHPSHGKGDRDARLDDEVAHGGAALDLDVGGSPYGTWSPLVRVELLRAIQPDEGLVQALRRALHVMSEWARPRTVP